MDTDYEIAQEYHICRHRDLGKDEILVDYTVKWAKSNVKGEAKAFVIYLIYYEKTEDFYTQKKVVSYENDSNNILQEIYYNIHFLYDLYSITEWELLTNNFDTYRIHELTSSCKIILPTKTDKLINIIKRIYQARETTKAVKKGNSSIDKIALFNSYLDSLAALYKEETENGGSVENVDTIKKNRTK